MKRYLLSQPKIVRAKDFDNLTLQLNNGMDELGILANGANPLVEIVVRHISGAEVELLIRHQSWLTIVVDSSDKRPFKQAVKAKTFRGLGQGIRCYMQSGISPTRCFEYLLNGLTMSLTPSLNFDEQVSFSLNDQSPFDIMMLEDDIRQHLESDVQLRTSEMLNRPMDFAGHSRSMAVEIMELDLLRKEISQCLLSHPLALDHDFSIEMNKQDHLLQSRRNWLFRAYQQTVSRPSLACASNSSMEDIEHLQRKLECYELLSPDSVVTMVSALSKEEN